MSGKSETRRGPRKHAAAFVALFACTLDDILGPREEPGCGGKGWRPEFYGPNGLASHDMKPCPGCDDCAPPPRRDRRRR